MPSQKKIIYKALGLYGFPNQYSAPEGALSDCLDIFIDRPGVVEAARTTETLATLTLTATYTGLARGFPTFQGRGPYAETPALLVQECKGATYPICGYLRDSAGVNWGDPGGKVLSFFEANGNAYASTCGLIGSNVMLARGTQADGTAWTAGNKRPSSMAKFTWPGTMVVRGAGMPEAPIPAWYAGNAAGAATLTASGIASLTNYANTNHNKTWGALGDGTAGVSGVGKYQRAYRVLFSTKDANGNLVRGAPSGRLIVYQPTTDFGILVIGLDRLIAGDIVQLYASELVDTTLQTSEPSDDMRLVYEHVVTSTDITNGYYTIQDIASDSLRGAALYTNDTQDGILMAEYPPPPASLCTWFKNVAWYAGCRGTGASELVLQLIGLDNFQTGATKTTISIASTGGASIITADTAEDLPNSKFKVYTSGTPSQNLRDTARSICNAINYKSFFGSANLNAAYVTAPSDTVPTIIIKGPLTGYGLWDPRGYASVRVQVSNPLNSGVNMFSPDTASNAIVDSGTFDNSLYPTPDCRGRLYYSKPNQPEGVPSLNYVTIGNPSVPITGLAHIRDSLFVFKTEGLYRVTGTTAADIRVEEFDATVKMAPGLFTTIASAGNQIFALTNQGVVSITESGVTIISRALESDLYAYNSRYANPDGPNGDIAYWSASGAASESERKYFLAVNVKSTGSPTLYTYNFTTQAWTKMTAPGTTNFTGVAVYNPGDYTSGQDYVCFLRSDSSIIKNMVRIGNPGNNPAPCATSPTWTYCINADMNAAMQKRFRTVTIVTGGSGAIANLTATFSSDTGASPTSFTIVPTSQNVCQLQVPSEHSLAGALTLKITGPSSGGNTFMVSEVQISYNETSEWVTK